MKSLKIIFLFLLVLLVFAKNEHRLYRRLVLDAPDWSKFIHKQINFDVKTKIECGASCNFNGDQCDMFVHKNDDTVCYVGIFENGNQNFLTGQSGNHPVYLSIGTL